MKILPILTGVLIMSLPAMTFASVTLVDEQGNVQVTQEVNDNAFIAGNTVNILAPIAGDAFIAGGSLNLEGNILDNAFLGGQNIQVNTTIGNDAFIMGGTIDVNEKVEGDLRMAGEVIFIKNTVGGDLDIGGRSITVLSGATIERDAIIAGQNISLQGTVNRNVTLYGENIDLEGKILGNLKIFLSKGGKITVGPNAVIAGTIEYSASEKNPELEALSQNTTYTPLEKDITDNEKAFSAYLISGFILFRFLSLFIIGSLFFFLFQDFFLKTGEFVTKRPGKSLLYGFLYYILLLFGSILLFLTIIGIPFGIFGIVLLVASFGFAKFFAVLGTVGFIISKLGGRECAIWKKILILAGVALVFSFLSGIDFILTLFAVGAMLGVLCHARLTYKIP